MYPWLASLAIFWYQGLPALSTDLYLGLPALSTFLYLGLSALGTFVYLGLSALGKFVYLGLDNTFYPWLSDDDLSDHTIFQFHTAATSMQRSLRVPDNM